jgi:hypothetical protein
MNTFRKFFAAVVLTLVLTVSSFAGGGDISFPGGTNPSPQPKTSATINTSVPDVTSIVTSDVATLNPVTAVFLNLIGSVYLFF